MDSLGRMNGAIFYPNDSYAIGAGTKGSDCEYLMAVLLNSMRAQKAKRIGLLGAHEAAKFFSFLFSDRVFDIRGFSSIVHAL
jgi:hypothetical protein